MKFVSAVLIFAAFFALFSSCVLAGGNNTELVFSTTTSGTVVQTFVQQVTTITSCPCATNGSASVTATSKPVNLPLVVKSGSSSLRPGSLVVAGIVGGLSALGFILAWAYGFHGGSEVCWKCRMNWCRIRTLRFWGGGVLAKLALQLRYLLIFLMMRRICPYVWRTFFFLKCSGGRICQDIHTNLFQIYLYNAFQVFSPGSA